MPTKNKTENLGLNSWLGTDKPMREDFVSDNEKIDKAITDHLNDTDMHMSAEKLASLGTPFEIGVYMGDGNASKTISLDFAPKLAIVFLRSAPPAEYDAANGYTICNSAIIAANGGGGSLGGNIVMKTIRVSQSTTASNGRFTNLNKLNSPYVYIAFK